MKTKEQLTQEYLEYKKSSDSFIKKMEMDEKLIKFSLLFVGMLSLFSIIFIYLK